MACTARGAGAPSPPPPAAPRPSHAAHGAPLAPSTAALASPLPVLDTIYLSPCAPCPFLPLHRHKPRLAAHARPRRPLVPPQRTERPPRQYACLPCQRAIAAPAPNPESRFSTPSCSIPFFLPADWRQPVVLEPSLPPASAPGEPPAMTGAPSSSHRTHALSFVPFGTALTAAGRVPRPPPPAHVRALSPFFLLYPVSSAVSQCAGSWMPGPPGPAHE